MKLLLSPVFSSRPDSKYGWTGVLAADGLESVFPTQQVPTASMRGHLLAASMLLAAGVVPAQDSLRNSLTGDAAAEAQRQLEQGPQLYNFKAGDFRLLAAPSVELEYNDDVNLERIGAQSDFILRPALQLTGTYPITAQNVLRLSFGLGYDDYLEHSHYSGYRLTGDSLILFDMYIKELWISFHDRPSYFQNPSLNATLAGTGEFGGLMNSAGLTATWDMEAVQLTLGYDHQNFIASTGSFSYLNRSSELPVARVGIPFNSQLTAGVECSAGYTTYDEKLLNNNQSYSAGLYADWRPASYLRVQPRCGYTIYQFEHTSEAVPPMFFVGIPPIVETVQTSDLNSWYADLTVSRTATEAVGYSLSVGHEISLGLEADAIEDSYIRPGMSWAIFKDLTLNTSLYFEHGTQGAGNVSGNLSETFDWYGGALGLSYSLMKKLLVGLNYRLTLRTSDISTRDYAQDIVGIQLAYQLK
jgi:hypothetical protein